MSYAGCEKCRPEGDMIERDIEQERLTRARSSLGCASAGPSSAPRAPVAADDIDEGNGGEPQEALQYFEVKNRERDELVEEAKADAGEIPSGSENLCDRRGYRNRSWIPACRKCSDPGTSMPGSGSDQTGFWKGSLRDRIQ